jgi:hypothetical protein
MAKHYNNQSNIKVRRGGERKNKEERKNFNNFPMGRFLVVFSC